MLVNDAAEMIPQFIANNSISICDLSFHVLHEFHKKLLLVIVSRPQEVFSGKNDSGTQMVFRWHCGCNEFTRAIQNPHMSIIDHKFFHNIVISNSTCPSRYYIRIEYQSEKNKEIYLKIAAIMDSDNCLYEYHTIESIKNTFKHSYFSSQNS